MIQNYNPGGYTTVVDYELVFDDQAGRNSYMTDKIVSAKSSSI